jgi:uncharacterized iron-regulated membrane protein
MNTRVLFSHRARRVFFFIHLWMGLILGLWFALIGLSGSVLAWRFELQGMELARRFPLEKASAEQTIISVSQAIAAMKMANPNASSRELSTVTIPNSKMPFYSFSLGRNRATAQTVLIDPYSARVHPPVRMRTLVVGTIQQFHQRLIAGAKGYLFNGLLTVLAIPLLLSGLWLWWPTKLKHLKAHLTIKRGVSIKRTLYDLHNVMGIYLYLVLLVTTITGAMLVQQHVARDGGIANFLNEQEGPSQPRIGNNRRAENRARTERGGRNDEKPKVTPRGARLSGDAVLAAARQLRPQLELTRVTLPQKPDEVAQVTFIRPVGLVLNEDVFLNPYNGEEIKPSASEQREAPNAAPAARWSRALHLGEFGGVLSKLIYTVTGLMPLGLFVTGFLLWFRKKRAKLRKARA